MPSSPHLPQLTSLLERGANRRSTASMASAPLVNPKALHTPKILIFCWSYIFSNQVAQLPYDISWRAANDDSRPAWQPAPLWDAPRLLPAPALAVCCQRSCAPQGLGQAVTGAPSLPEAQGKCFLPWQLPAGQQWPTCLRLLRGVWPHNFRPKCLLHVNRARLCGQVCRKVRRAPDLCFPKPKS